MTGLITSADNPALAQQITQRLQQRGLPGEDFGPLAALALRLGLILGTAEPRLRRPQLLLFAADHGIAVDGVAPPGHPTTARCVQSLLAGEAPLGGLGRALGLPLCVVDAGIADRLPALEGLVTRKIAHGTRNARAGAAMTMVQTQAALRAGREIAETWPGNVMGCAGLGVGSMESAALVLAGLTDLPVDALLDSGPAMPPERLAHLRLVAQGVQARHPQVRDPIEVLAAFGGFEIAMMAGALLGAAQRRIVTLVDGLAACAALQVARQVDPAVADYALLCASRRHQGLARALAALPAHRLPALDVDALDGTGAVLAMPLLQAAVPLLAPAPVAVLPGSEAGVPRIDGRR